MLSTMNQPTVTIKRLDPYAELPKPVRKEAVKLVKLAKLKGQIPRSAQSTIPYRQMLRNGLCFVESGADPRKKLGMLQRTMSSIPLPGFRVEPPGPQSGFYTKTIEYFDTNYKLAKRETKENIFENWCNFLNYFDSTVSVQLTFVNQKIDIEEFYRAIDIPSTGDTFDELRSEYVQMLQNQFSKGNNGLVKRKYLTFGLHAEDQATALMKLNRIENEVINAFRDMKVAAFPRNGYERMEIMHDILNIGTDRKLNFNWDFIVKTGLSTKDFISPNSMNFSRKNIFELQELLGRVSFLQINAPELSDDILAQFLEMDTPLVINIHLHSLEQAAAIKQIKDTMTDLNKMKIEEQMKASRSGYGMDILPPDLVTYIDEADALRHDLESRNERRFLLTFTLTNFAKEEKELDNIFSTAKQIAQQHSCELLPLDWQQEAGLMSALPIGINKISIERMLTTSSTAIFIPFQTQELFQKGGLYYGVNATSQNMIMIDRLTAKNPNGLILGVPGSGKSFASKREMVNVALVRPKDSILILDPEREYTALVRALGGQVIMISADSPHHINPMDLNIEAKNDEDSHFDPIRDKSEFLMSFCEQVMGAGEVGLQPIEKTVIDRCVALVYEKYMKDPIPDNIPILGDFYELLKAQKEVEAHRIASALELYVSGSFNVFNHRTNVEVKNRIVCFDTKDLGQHLKGLGMLTVQDQIWSRVRTNRARKLITWYYADEIHLLLNAKQTASALVEIWKRFRKWGGVPTGITQNVTDFLASPQIKNIFSNSDFIYMLNQAAGDQKILAEELNISEHQLNYVTNTKPGQGLLIFGGTIIPFVDDFPEDTQLYKLMSTKLEEAVTS